MDPARIWDLVASQHAVPDDPDDPEEKNEAQPLTTRRDFRRDNSPAMQVVENGRIRDPQRTHGIFELTDDEHDELRRAVQAHEARLQSLRRNNQRVRSLRGGSGETKSDASGSEIPLSSRYLSQGPSDDDLDVNAIGNALQSLDQMASEAAALVDQYERFFGNNDPVLQTPLVPIEDGYVLPDESGDNTNEEEEEMKGDTL